MKSLVSLTAITLAAGLALMACDSSGGSNSLSPQDTTVCDAYDQCPWNSSVTTSCAPNTVIDEAGAAPNMLKELLNDLSYSSVGPYSNKSLPLTDTFTIASSIHAPELTLPEGVMSDRTQIAFRIGGQEAAFDAVLGTRIATEIPGVTCTKPDSYNSLWCETVEFDNANVRFRGLILDTHPSEYNFVAVIDILPGCSASCESEQQPLLCPTGACWQSMEQYCRLCWGGFAEVCACATQEGLAPSDSYCEYAKSGDIFVGGTCQSGTCVTSFPTD